MLSSQSDTLTLMNPGLALDLIRRRLAPYLQGDRGDQNGDGDGKEHVAIDMQDVSTYFMQYSGTCDKGFSETNRKTLIIEAIPLSQP